MTVFEIVVHQQDTIIGMMYLDADNSSIHCKFQRQQPTSSRDNSLLVPETTAY